MYERYFGSTNIKKPLSLIRKSDDLKPFSDRLQLREEIDSSKAEHFEIKKHGGEGTKGKAITH